MTKSQLYKKIFLFFPEWFQLTFLKLLYFVTPKSNLKKQIKITEKTNNVISNLNLVIADNMKALGDFFVLLQVLVNIEKSDTDQKYVFFINGIYRKIVETMSFKKIVVIYGELNHTAYDWISYSNEEVINISKNISDLIFNYSKEWNNVFILSKTLDITQYSVLLKINYNNCFTLKSYETKKRVRTVYQNFPYPKFFLWLYIFNNRKKLNISYWNKDSKNFYYFAHMCFDMIKDSDDKLKDKQFHFYTFKDGIRKSNCISLMTYGSNDTKTLSESFLIKYLDAIKREDLNYVFLFKEKLDLSFASNINNIVNKTGQTPDFLDLCEQIYSSLCTITVDTSAFHIANFYGVPTITFILKNNEYWTKHYNFWLNNSFDKNLFIEVDKSFFNKKNNDWTKQEDKVKVIINQSKSKIDNLK